MTSLLLAAVICLAGESWALRQPDIAEQARIAFLIDKARNAVSDSNADYKRAFDRMVELERKMGLRDGDGPRKRAASEEDLKKLSCFWRDECGEYAGALRTLQVAVMTYERSMQEAAETARRVYDTVPSRRPLVVQSGDPRLVGRALFGDVQFDASNPGLDLPAGVRWSDGKIVVRWRAFVNLHGESDPGLLALYLGHELAHQELMARPGMDELIKNEPALEASLRLEALRFQSLYQLRPRDLNNYVREIAGMQAQARVWQQLIDKGFDPYDNRALFSNLRLPAGEIDRIDREVRADLDQLLPLYDGLDADAAAERIRAESASAFLKELGAADLRVVIAAWKASRDGESVRGPGDRVRILSGISLDADACGMAAVLEGSGVTGWTLKEDSHGNRYHMPSGVTVSAARANLVLARACADAGRGLEPQGACLGGVAEQMNVEWGNRDFRNLIGFGPFIPIGECVLALKDSLRLPFGGGDIASAAWQATEAHRRHFGIPRGGGGRSPEREGGTNRTPRERGDESERTPYGGPCGNGGSLCGGNAPRFPF